MKPEPINSPEDYADAVTRIEELIATNPREGSPEFTELQLWGEFMAAYEVEHFSY